MKNYTLFIFLILFIACNSDNKNNSSTNTDSKIVSDFLNDISTLESVDDKNPILLFQDVAKEKANKTYSLSINNIEDILVKAQEYKHCVITTGDHSIIKITDLNDCKQSGSWKTCMPYAKGYIKKGSLIFQEDYMNNIIGIPDSQIRTVFLFD